MIELTLPFTSRFKTTSLYTSSGKAFFGMWNPPYIRLDGDEKIITVNRGMLGQLNTIAFKEYGDSDLWWCIAYVNGIKNLNTEVVPGKPLVIPKLENIKSALLGQ